MKQQTNKAVDKHNKKEGDPTSYVTVTDMDYDAEEFLSHCDRNPALYIMEGEPCYGD